MVKLILYHRTTTERAEAILQDRFRDHVGTYGTGREWSGVWLSDRPLTVNEGACGDALLQVSLDCIDSDICDYEWVQEPSFGYREWLIPAAFVNARASVSLVSDDEDEEGDVRANTFADQQQKERPRT